MKIKFLTESVIVQRIRRALKRAGLISEGIEDNYDERIPVNIYVGRFQPFHLGHLSNLEEAAKLGLRTVICPVVKGTSLKSIQGHPFDDIDDKIFERLKAAYSDLIIDVVKIQNPYKIDEWLPAIRKDGCEPISWTTGQDRAESYNKIIETNKEKLGLVKNFKLIVLDKNIDGENGSAENTADISGSLIRGEGPNYTGRCLRNPDKEAGRKEFEAMMPRCLWDMYDEMRDILSAVDNNPELNPAPKKRGRKPKDQNKPGEPAVTVMGEPAVSSSLMEAKINKLNESISGFKAMMERLEPVFKRNLNEEVDGPTNDPESWEEQVYYKALEIMRRFEFDGDEAIDAVEHVLEVYSDDENLGAKSPEEAAVPVAREAMKIIDRDYYETEVEPLM